MHPIVREVRPPKIVKTARDLTSEGDDAPDYNRALVELTTELLRLDPEAGPALRLLYPDPGSPDLHEVVRLAITGRSA